MGMLWRRASFCPRAICVVRILMRRSSWGLGGLADRVYLEVGLARWFGPKIYRKRDVYGGGIV